MNKEFVDESKRDQTACVEAALDKIGGVKKETVSEARTRVRKLVDRMNPSFKAVMLKIEHTPEHLKKQKEWLDSFDDSGVSDAVHKPSHYQILPGVEVIDVRKALFKKIPEGTTPFAIDAYSRSWEYLTRMWGKNRLEDARKAKVYLEWLITELEATEKAN